MHKTTFKILFMGLIRAAINSGMKEKAIVALVNKLLLQWENRVIDPMFD